jgi:ribosomal protein L37AE/L43A
MEIMEILIIPTYGVGCFLAGFFLGNRTQRKKKKRKSHFVESDAERLHCFDCEIEMPVKEKNGRMYCSNCGLPH